MNLASSETIVVLNYLLPGFVAAGLFRSLIVSTSKPGGVDVIAQAFIFTVFVTLIAAPVFWMIEIWTGNSLKSKTDIPIVMMINVTISVLLGLISAYLWNKGMFHRLCRRLKVTRLGHSPEYSAFALYDPCYVVLHLAGDRRLYGWPAEWPCSPDDQHLLITEGEWLDGKDPKPDGGVSHILIPKSEVNMIEFLFPEFEK